MVPACHAAKIAAIKDIAAKRVAGIVPGSREIAQMTRRHSGTAYHNPRRRSMDC